MALERLCLVEKDIAFIKTDVAVIKANQEHSSNIQTRIEDKIDEICQSLKCKAEGNRLEALEDRMWKLLVLIITQLCGLIFIFFRMFNGN